MPKDWIKILKEAGESNAALAFAAPEAMKEFSQLVCAATDDGVLDRKTKELIATAIAICTQCDGCIAFHVNGSIIAGATRDEMAETIAVAVEMGGDPATVFGAGALEAYDQMSGEKSTSPE